MRRLLLIAALLFVPANASAQAPAADLKTLFDVAQALGTESELRGDIAERLGLGHRPLPIMDLVVTEDGVQHALNAFVIAGTPYILFNSHLHMPEVYIFVRGMDGALIAGLHGRQYQPITNTVEMTPSDADMVVGPEEAFWFKWLANGAKMPPGN